MNRDSLIYIRYFDNKCHACEHKPLLRAKYIYHVSHVKRKRLNKTSSYLSQSSKTNLQNLLQLLLQHLSHHVIVRPCDCQTMRLSAAQINTNYRRRKPSPPINLHHRSDSGRAGLFAPLVQCTPLARIPDIPRFISPSALTPTLSSFSTLHSSLFSTRCDACAPLQNWPRAS